MDRLLTRYFVWLRLWLAALLCLPYGTLAVGFLSFQIPPNLAYISTIFPLIYLAMLAWGWRMLG
ncbi:MAG: hypothetical protein ACRD3W_03775, partial [Terriglobales bacterium]